MFIYRWVDVKVKPSENNNFCGHIWAKCASVYEYKYHGSPATIFNRLVYEPSFFKQGFIIIQKELLFSKWMVDFQGISNNLKPIDNLGFEFSQW